MQRRLDRLALLLPLLAAVQFLSIFMVEWYAIRQLGMGRAVDSVFVGMTMPMLLAQVMANSLISVLVPLLAVREAAAGRRLAWSMMLVVAGGGVVVAAALAATARLWVPLVAPGFRGGYELAIAATRIQLIGVVALACNAVLTAAWNARDRFVWPPLAGALSAWAALALEVALLPRLGAAALAWAQVLMAAGQTLLLLPLLGMPRGAWPLDAGVRDAWRRLKPLVASSVYFRTEILLMRILASFLPAGGVTIVSLAQRIMVAVAGLFTSGLATPVFTPLSQHWAQGRRAEFMALMRRSVLRMAWLTLACVAVLALVGLPVTGWVFGGRAVAPEDVRLLWLTLLAMGGLLVGAAVGQLYANGFYAAGDTRTPALIGTAGYTVGIGLRIGGVVWLGAIGLGLAASLHYLLNAGVYAWRLRTLPGRPAVPARG